MIENQKRIIRYEKTEIVNALRMLRVLGVPPAVDLPMRMYYSDVVAFADDPDLPDDAVICVRGSRAFAIIKPVDAITP